VKNVTDLFPIPDRLNISRADWIATPPVTRDEIIRAWQELSAGIAVGKDRRCGREKSNRRPRNSAVISFYELHLLDMETWHRPNAKKIAQADALRKRLEPDVERLRLEDERDAGLAPFHALAKAGGTTVAAMLGEYVTLENVIRAEPLTGLKMLARKCDIDLADVMTVVHAGVHLAHSMLLQKAADAIWADPDKDWNGLHFGFMADEVQRVCPECVAKQPNGYLAVDYERLSKTPEAQSLPVYHYRYKDGGNGVVEPVGEVA
jgi:hypothetical protein